MKRQLSPLPATKVKRSKKSSESEQADLGEFKSRRKAKESVVEKIDGYINKGPAEKQSESRCSTDANGQVNEVQIFEVEGCEPSVGVKSSEKSKANVE